MIKKKGQEEIVGFVLIVSLVVVVLVILLVIMLRSGQSETRQESRELYQFLESVMEYTSSCTSLSYQPAYFNIQELLRECRNKRTCSSGKEACAVLNDTLSDMLASSWKVGPDRPYSGYQFNITYRTNTTSEEILMIAAGNCSAYYRGADYLTPPIISSFNLCYDLSA